MISLKEYFEDKIRRSNMIYDDYDNELINHCNIHNKSLFYYIWEGTGAFPQQHDLVKTLLAEIKDAKESTYVIKLNSYKFIESVYIHFKKDSNSNVISGSYISGSNNFNDYNLIRWDEKNQKFKFAEIDIYNYHGNLEELEEILYHETSHLWYDYIDKSKKKRFLNDEVENSLSKKLQNNKEISKGVKDIIYYSEKYEIDAYIKQLNGVLGNSKYDSIKDALYDIIHKCPVYQNYKVIINWLNDDKNDKIMLDYVSPKELKKIKANIRKCWKKIINHTYLILGEHVNESYAGHQLYNIVEHYEKKKKREYEISNKVNLVY